MLFSRGIGSYSWRCISLENQAAVLDVGVAAMDADGEIVKAMHVMGILPPGSELHSNGKIVVKDQRLLESGAYTAGIVTVDENGGITFF